MALELFESQKVFEDASGKLFEEGELHSTEVAFLLLAQQPLV